MRLEAHVSRVQRLSCWCDAGCHADSPSRRAGGFDTMAHTRTLAAGTRVVQSPYPHRTRHACAPCGDDDLANSVSPARRIPEHHFSRNPAFSSRGRLSCLVTSSPQTTSWCRPQHDRFWSAAPGTAQRCRDSVHEQWIGRELDRLLPVRLNPECPPDARHRGLRELHLFRKPRVLQCVAAAGFSWSRPRRTRARCAHKASAWLVPSRPLHEPIDLFHRERHRLPLN